MAARRRQKQEQRRAKKAQTAPEAAQETTPSQPSSEPESPPEPAVAVAPETEAEPAADLPPEREPCINCGTTRGGLTTAKKYERTKGRCQSCYNHYRRTGKDKPIPSTKGAVA